MSIRTGVKLAILTPVAAIGVTLNWIPYRLTGWLAPRITREEDVLGTVKLLLGLLLFPLAWVFEAFLLGKFQGSLTGLALLLLAPITGYAALRFEEQLRRLRGETRQRCFYRNSPRAAAQLHGYRQALAKQVAAELDRRLTLLSEIPVLRAFSPPPPLPFRTRGRRGEGPKRVNLPSVR